MTKIRLVLSSLTLCLFLLPGIAIAQNQVTVTDDQAPHAPCLRYDTFSTDLTATVANPPQSTTETTITGPTYAWSCSTSGFSMTYSSNSATATLNGPTPTKSDYLAPGTNNIPVTCTVTYTSTVNATGVQTPISFTGSCTVTFFVRVPSIVIPNGAAGINVYWANESQNTVYGHVTTYPLQMEDNQPTPQAYGNGLPHEEFSNINPAGATLNTGGPSTWGIDYSNGTGTPSDDFTDNNGAVNESSTHLYSTFMSSFSQTWYCLELTPPYNAPGANLYVPVPNNYQDGVNTPTLSGFSSNVSEWSTDVHSLYLTWGLTQRTIPGYPPY